MTSSALKTSRPQLAVSASVFRDDKILLIRRARQPAKGIYTLPGGRVEFGESLIDAVRREVQEETGLRTAVVGFAGWQEVLPHPTTGMTEHFIVMSFAAHWSAGDLILNDEVDDARWVDPTNLSSLRITEGLNDIITLARTLLGG